jgi:Glycosyltransferase family 87
MDGVRLGPSWQSPAAMPRRWLAGVFAVSGIYAVLVFVLSSDHVHRLWGAIAACGYVAALIAIAVWKKRGTDVALAVAFCGSLLVPLGWLAEHSLEQPEVAVVARSGFTLIHHFTPYASVASLASNPNPNAYNPYLPVMSFFGVPRALAGGVLTDPRIWFGLAFVIVFWFALRQAGAKDSARWTVLVGGCPVIAFNLATGGDDVPMVAVLCLGFAYLWQPEPVKAGLALGVAASMKATAWPALAVALALLAARDGKRAAVRFTLTAAGAMVVCIGPFLTQARALIENTVVFPLGLAHVTSAAASPLPGHLIADTGHLGHTIVVVLLVLACLAIGGLLVFRPPRTVPRAMILLIGAMTLMFLLAPSTRYGYFIYPITLAIWLLATLAVRETPEADVTRDPDEPPASLRTKRRTSPVTPPVA